jgi:hypothetical protein
MYRHWVDADGAGGRTGGRCGGRSARLARTSLVYTRGFGDGFLGGSDHQTLVEGRFRSIAASCSVESPGSNHGGTVIVVADPRVGRGPGARGG